MKDIQCMRLKHSCKFMSCCIKYVKILIKIRNVLMSIPIDLIIFFFFFFINLFRWINWYFVFELHVSGFPLNPRARCRSKWTSSLTCTATWKWSARPRRIKRQVSVPSLLRFILYIYFLMKIGKSEKRTWIINLNCSIIKLGIFSRYGTIND